MNIMAAGERSTKKKRGSTRENKLGVKNSLVNNINAGKKKGKARSNKKSTISTDSYDDMQDNWRKKS
jgi:hypothetical protein